MGKVAVVTGAGNGLGRAEARLLAKEGASVIVNDVAVSPDGTAAAEEVADVIRREGGRAVASSHDVSEPEAAKELMDIAFEAFGRLDILLNNAGVISGSLVEGTDVHEWNRVLNVNLRGTFLLTKYAIPGFKSQRSGVIVNTSSESGLGHPTASHYAASKEGIIGFTRSVAREVGGSGIRCNAIRPKARGTLMGEGYSRQTQRWRRSLEALGRYRLGERGNIAVTYPAEDVAPMAVWLCTDSASAVNGVTFQVEGRLIGVWSEPTLLRSLVSDKAWDLSTLDENMGNILTDDCENRFHVEFQ